MSVFAPYTTVLFELNPSNNYKKTIQFSSSIILKTLYFQLICSETIPIQITGLPFVFYSIENSQILASNKLLPDNNFFYKLNSNIIKDITVELADTPPANINSLAVSIIFCNREPSL